MIRIFPFLIFFLAFAFGGEPSFSETPEEKIGVMVTISPLADFVEQVGGERVAVQMMVPPGADPHTYEPTPAQLVALSKAKLYVAAGSGLEFELAWLDKLKALNRKMFICDSSRGIRLLGAEADDKSESGSGRHRHRFDPHIWLSPKNAMVMVKNITESLILIDSSHQKFYGNRSAFYIAQLNDLDSEIRTRLSEYQNRDFLVYHPAWAYFASEYHLQEISVEADGKEPTAARLVSLIQNAKRKSIKAIFVSPRFKQKSIQVIAKETGSKVIAADDLAKNYLENMRHVSQEIAGALQN